jgi:hypothetical protein
MHKSSPNDALQQGVSDMGHKQAHATLQKERPPFGGLFEFHRTFRGDG